MKNKKLVALTVATLSTSLVIGGSIYATNVLPTKSTTPSYITAEKAKEIALSHAKVAAKDAVFVKVKLDKDDSNTEYEIEFYAGKKEYDYDIDAVSGKVLSFDADAEYYNPTKKANPTKAPNGKTYITANKAKEIALKHAGLTEKNVTGLKVNFDYDDGVGEYEIEFYANNKEYEYEINALTSVIISVEQDDNDDDNISSVSGATQKGTVNNTGTTQNITAAQAKAIAFKQAGIVESNVRDLKVKFDYDDGLAEYEVEFEVGNTEYSYDINAATGAIISSEIDD